MKSMTLTWGAVLASALFALAPAQAAPADPSHEAAINACSTVNPAQPVMVLSAVNDGSGIGFSLVWMNDKDGNLWMCDADANGNVYTYSLPTKDLLKGGGAELLGLQPTVNGGYVGQPQKIAENVCAAYLADGGKVLASTPDGLQSDPALSCLWRTRTPPSISATRRATP